MERQKMNFASCPSIAKTRDTLERIAEKILASGLSALRGQRTLYITL
jgi:hypothetical protein